jgi:hypothetical protein
MARRPRAAITKQRGAEGAMTPTNTGRWTGLVAAAALTVLAGWSCASGPEAPARREIPALWRAAGEALPASDGRTRFLALADDAVAEAAALRRHEADAFEALTVAGERHDVSRADLYVPFGTLAPQRHQRLMAYAKIRVEMREALTADEWATVVKGVK